MINNSGDHAQTLQEFIKITTLLSKERNFDRLLTQVVSSTRLLVNAQASLVWLLDATKRHLYLETYMGGSKLARPENVQPIELYDARKQNERNIVAHAAFSGKSINIVNIYEYTGYQFDTLYRLDKILGTKTASCLTVPLIDHEGITVGVLQMLNALNKEGEVISFDDNDENLVRALGCQAAVAIENTKLFEENRYLIKALDESNRKLRQENKSLIAKMHGHYDFSRIIGNSDAIKKILGLIKKILPSDATVLILGETGTGKELVAQSIHYNSNRREKQFVVQNCAALPENLLESELFGYKKGAFSGAGADKKGLIELADGGTLFLDEIGDMPLGLQAKILRVLQEKEVRPLGGTVARRVNVRIVAATHQDLASKVKLGSFREDLFYRLTIFPVTVPPLRDRRDDIPALVKYFIDQLAQKYEKEIIGISPVVLNFLMRYRYPGNVRELRNIIERSILLADSGGHLLPEHFDEELALAVQSSENSLSLGNEKSANGKLRELLEKYESGVIRAQLARHRWNQTQAAEALGVSRRTLIDKIARYKIQTVDVADDVLL
ncbi:MAG: sigma 54-interacting transcriptional regulator [Gammaproteobacteria bacterium]|nr:sigma 54-interacting transcriptional regulator [Gammaproteobacteria bacterium]